MMYRIYGPGKIQNSSNHRSKRRCSNLSSPKAQEGTKIESENSCISKSIKIDQHTPRLRDEKFDIFTDLNLKDEMSTFMEPEKVYPKLLISIDNFTWSETLRFSRGSSLLLLVYILEDEENQESLSIHLVILLGHEKLSLNNRNNVLW